MAPEPQREDPAEPIIQVTQLHDHDQSYSGDEFDSGIDCDDDEEFRLWKAPEV
ncbi:hypothetical protein BT96DRAFT_912169 [Gymnopus androsaceus JB14]|uniref:Uncharacterized protein n=1 Tax=Gymnopus androsaceus JB14 TaxID=1447944 RepID=A0A6A4IQ13_9AGAR|nr:hypothetical protein BT96DRAFT_912169 [Gymnopus androsaceus JB14]